MRLYKQKNSNNWYVYFTLGGESFRISTGTSDKNKAEAKGHEIWLDTAAARKRGSSGALPFAEAAGMAAQMPSKDSSLLGRIDFWCERFCDCNVDEIMPANIKIVLAIERQKRGWSDATCNRYLAALSKIFAMARDTGKSTHNPVADIPYYRETPRIRYLKLEELNNLVESCGDEDVASLIMAAANTGMRRGELLALRKADIDREKRLITVRDSKNGDARRIPLNSTALDVFPVTDPVFPLAESTVRYHFEKARDTAGLSDVRFHDLRHTFACHMRMQGCELQTLQRLLGHKSIEMTLRYADFGGKYVDMARDDVERLYS